MTQLEKYIANFNKQRVAVIGDLMLDKYIIGTVERISPEAPIPIVAVKSERYAPGGAANVATNISTLSAKPFLFGIVGNDEAKNILLSETEKLGVNSNGVFTSITKSTIQKIRVIGQNQQLVRIDYEDTDYLDNEAKFHFLSTIKKLKNISIVVISDYAKGTITQGVLNFIKKVSIKNNLKIIIDPKPINKSFYNDVFLITPNKKEAEEISGIKITDNASLMHCGKNIISELSCNVIITLGDKGMAVFEKSGNFITIPTVAREVYDVSGAGDTVTATIAIALSAGASITEAAVLANYAAGIKVAKIGTAPVYLSELKKYLVTNK